MADHSRPHRNTYWVVPGHLLAGEYPGADDPDEARGKLDRFLACGIDGFVDLTVEGEAAPYRWLLQELASRRGVGVAYRRYPVTDRGVPDTPDQMDVILRQIVEWLQADRRVYVHCRGGVGRTGTVIGCYLVQSGLSGDEALERLQQLWSFVSEVKRSCFPRSPQTPEQASYVRNWSRDEIGARDVPRSNRSVPADRKTGAVRMHQSAAPQTDEPECHGPSTSAVRIHSDGGIR